MALMGIALGIAQSLWSAVVVWPIAILVSSRFPCRLLAFLPVILITPQQTLRIYAF